MVNYLEALGYTRHDKPTAKELKDSWKKLCREHHPDVNGGDSEKFLEITHAYKMLTDNEYRFKHQLDEKRRQNRNAVGDLNIRIQVPLKFEETFFGRDSLVLTWNMLRVNEDSLVFEREEEQDLYTHVFNVPPGAPAAMEVVVPNAGHGCGENRGHAIVNFITTPHQKFRLIRGDVHAIESIPLALMLKGGTVDVQTMYGIKTLRVPPGTVPGAQLIIKRCGLNKSGNHVVTVQPIYPQKDELRGEGWKGLGINWDEAADDEEDDPEVAKLMGMFSGMSRKWGDDGTS